MASVEEIRGAVGEFTDEAENHGGTLRELQGRVDDLKQKLSVIVEGSSDGRTEQALSDLDGVRERIDDAAQGLASAVSHVNEWVQTL